jgi:preprotein translocase subunit SecE
MAKKSENSTEKKSRWAAAQDKAAKAQKSRKTARAKQSNQNKKKEKKGGILEYFKGVKLEMKKVVWPTRKELGSFTAVVLATCAAFALLFWGVDSGVLAAIKAICF